MNKLASLLISMMLIMAFGLTLAPRPCLGDGQGGACHVEACACVSACSCQFAHEAERARAAHGSQDVASCCELPEATSASSCHGQGQIPHFAPPDRDWYALSFLLPLDLVLMGYAPEATVWYTGRLDMLPQPPPEKPPKLLA